MWLACAAQGSLKFPPDVRLMFWILAGQQMYGAFTRRGLFSVLDIVTLFSPVPASSPHRNVPSVLSFGDPSPHLSARVGVVLAGGGGKGAYQIGCWSALRKHGVRVDAVAGTSAGALNLALWIQNDIERARHVWANLSASQLVKLDFLALPFLPLLLERHRRRREHSSIGAIVTVALCSMLLVMPLAWFLSRMLQLANSSGGTSVGRSVFWTLFVVDAAICLAQLLLFLFSVFSPVRALVPQPSLLRTAGLHRLIESIVPSGSCSHSTVEAFVTVAIEHFTCEPISNYERTVDTDAGGLARCGFGRRRVYLPRYLSLREVERKSGIRFARFCLELSSAIPIVFSARRWSNLSVGDGGIADNVPLRPLLEFGCNRIFVIHLDDRGMDVGDGEDVGLLTKAGVATKLAGQRRLDRLVACRAEVETLCKAGLCGEARRVVSECAVNDELDAIGFDTEIVNVVPSQSLGSFVTGTLNFSGRKAQRLMKLGEADMDTLLRSLYVSPI